MKERLQFDYTDVLLFVNQEEVNDYKNEVAKAHELLHNKNGVGKEYLGWLDLPLTYDKDEVLRIHHAAEKIKNDSDVLIVIGVGGSYLGARAAIEALQYSFYNLLSSDDRKGPQIFFVGQNLSSTYMADLLKILQGKDFSINVISKSGTTTEPAIAFRVFRESLEQKYGKEEASNRIYATTDKENGALKTLANEEGYHSFVIPDDIGGRYSVLTAVGLLPLAVAGIDIELILQGAKDAYHAYNQESLKDNECYQYAVLRNIFYDQEKKLELLVNYEPHLNYIAEWWKQLFGESEGKDGKGIFPAAVNYPTDLHSFGQYVQDGERHLFQTILYVKKPREELVIPNDNGNLDNLNYLEGKTIDFVNNQAFQGALLAHTEGGVPNLVITIPEMNEYHFGYLVYFFEKACAMSGYLLGVNPFDQPGVEVYKRNMFKLLGKPGC